MKDPGCRDSSISVDASFGFAPFPNLSVIELDCRMGHNTDGYSSQVGTLGGVNT